MMTVMATLLIDSEVMAELWVEIFFLVFCDGFADNGDGGIGSRGAGEAPRTVKTMLEIEILR